MAEIIFYEKPGCINNTKQKKLLEEAGHHVDAHNLLTYTWTESELLSFFQAQELEVSQWFNKSAPQITSGEVKPHALSADEAIALMLENPLLIRRPLMQIRNIKLVGFDIDIIKQVITIADTVEKDMETCPVK